MGFLKIFYKYMIQQYFTVTAPGDLFSQYKTNKILNADSCTQGNMRLRWGFLTIFYKYMIQQYFTFTAPNTAFSQYLKK